MRVLIVTDAAPPQVNGVVTTLTHVSDELKKMGHIPIWLHPQLFLTVPLPFYKEIDVAVNVWSVGKAIRHANVDAIHIATPEGSLGLAAKLYCDRKKIPYTTSYHTRFPEYVNKRLPFIPLSLLYKFARWVHSGAQRTLCTTRSMVNELESHGFENLVEWTRGVDVDMFNPTYRTKPDYVSQRTVLYVGRVSVEKNLEAFLELPKSSWSHMVVVGDGPDRKRLERQYPHAEFVGYKHGEELAKYYAEADVFVFPSKTDTFGLVMLEATACGTPVAAYPVPGPKDIIVNKVNGCLDDDLEYAVEVAALCSRNGTAGFTRDNYSWEQCGKIFEANMKYIAGE